MSFSQPFAGDYRSNPSTSGGGFLYGTWSTIANWETYNGTAWVAASAAPTSADGIITILAGDSMIIDAAVTIDQVVVESGGSLAIFNTGAAFTTTLNDGAGVDIDVSGRLTISTNATLSGAGTVQINNNGFFVMRNSGVLSVATTNNGTATLTHPATINGTTFTNNGTMLLTSNNGTFNIPGSTVTNNGTAIITGTGFLGLSGAGGTFTNTAIGVLFKESTTTNTTLNTSINFNNAGTLRGFGTFTRAVSGATTTNTGTIAPGNTAGTSAILTLGTPLLTAASTPTFNIEINSTGAVAGTNFDQVVVPGSVNITGSSLNLTNDVSNTTDPAGTSFIILQATVGTITGPFAAVNLPNNFVITYNATNVIVTKTAMFPLPVVWGDFSILAGKDAVLIQWSTLSEQNASHFIVEYSVDGVNFSPLSIVQASGNPLGAKYSYTHKPNTFKPTNFYRIRQVDFDGRAIFTSIRRVQIKDNQPRFVELLQNPVSNSIKLDIQSENITLAVYNQSGQLIQSFKTKPGLLNLESSNWAKGTYFISVLKEGVKDVLTVIKQ